MLNEKFCRSQLKRISENFSKAIFVGPQSGFAKLWKIVNPLQIGEMETLIPVKKWLVRFH